MVLSYRAYRGPEGKFTVMINPYQAAQALFLVTPDASAEDVHRRIRQVAEDDAAVNGEQLVFLDPGVEKVAGWLDHFRRALAESRR